MTIPRCIVFFRFFWKPLEMKDDFEELRSKLKLTPERRLTLNTQEMILLPRYFFRFFLREIKRQAGDDIYENVLFTAAQEGAVIFCRRFREVHQCTPVEAVQGYLNEMNLRGWGKFTITQLDSSRGIMEVLLENSAICEEDDIPSGHIIWKTSMIGTMIFLEECPNQPSKRKFSASLEETGDGCRIQVKPAIS
jgi:hypothetical protein